MQDNVFSGLYYDFKCSIEFRHGRHCPTEVCFSVMLSSKKKKKVCWIFLHLTAVLASEERRFCTVSNHSL